MENSPKSSNSLIKITACIGLVVFAASPSQAASLTGGEIRKELIGSKITFKFPDGTSGWVRYSKSGKARVSVKKPKRLKDRGNWRIKGNRICNTWKKVRKGKEKCFSYTKIGPRKYKGTDGSILTR